MKIRLVGVPSAWGTKELGARRTPGILRDVGLLEWLAAPGLEVEDGGDVEVPPQADSDIWSARAEAAAALREAPKSAGDARNGSTTNELVHLDEVVAMATAVRAAVTVALVDGALPLIVGGECCLSIGVVPALAEHRGPVTTAWFDAHGDINTPESSESGLITGMPFAVVMGEGHPDLLGVGAGTERPTGAATWLFGGRDIDPGEIDNIERFGIHHVKTTEARALDAESAALMILRLPHAAIMPFEARAQVDAAGRATSAERETGTPGAAMPNPNVYIHFDVDSLDPEWAPGVHYRVDGGFHPAEVSGIAGNLCTSGSVGTISIASANLDHDEDGRTVDSIRSFVASIADALSMAT